MALTDIGKGVNRASPQEGIHTGHGGRHGSHLKPAWTVAGSIVATSAAPAAWCSFRAPLGQGGAFLPLPRAGEGQGEGLLATLRHQIENTVKERLAVGAFQLPLVVQRKRGDT